MKNLFLSAAIVLGSLTSFASTSPTSNKIVKTISIQDEYTEIKVEEVPAAITDALKKAYPDAVLSKAYKNAKSEYKLDVTVGDKVGSLYANADGTWIKK
jgi:archaellum biogenesis protein FlaJ (TadC family)